MPSFLFILGTRPEVIKLAPVILECRKRPSIAIEVIHTGQHKELAGEMFSHFGIEPDHNLEVMQPNQSLFQLSARIITGLEKIITGKKYDMVFVQGDTTSVFLGALCAFYSRIPVAHVEAGLRTADRYSPFPEEINRRLAGTLATLHFPPTERARQMLIDENVAKENIFTTGNTVIDALEWSINKPHQLSAELEDFFTEDRKTILVTTHRRENFGGPHREVFSALLRIVNKFKDTQILFPIHPNPNVRNEAYQLLNQHPRIKLISPLGYLDFINVMKRSHIILTDSGGVQEEAPSLNKPVLILRESTERPEGIESGCLKLVGTNQDAIFAATSQLLTEKARYDQMANSVNPYGDGKAAERIIDHALDYIHRNKTSK
jgi:UDP-N-acetylglucosamine 2-epimerase (non-hydrolysing)